MPDERYQYDGLNRLTRWYVNNAQQQTWTLDSMGNDLSTGSYNAANEFTTINGATNNPTYDAAGNMTFDGALAYKYDAWGRLVAVYNGSLSGDQVAAYSYDGLGRRIQTKTYTDGTLSATQDYYLNQSDQVVVNFGQGEAASDTWYLWGVRNVQDLVLYVNSDGAYRVLQDANWNVTAFADAASGAVLERYYYSAYGTATVCNPDWTAVSGNESQYGNTVLFAGMDLDPATGLYYDRARWYSPSLGVFTTQDPAQADANLYRYCGNEPTEATDPSGLVIIAESKANLGDALRNTYHVAYHQKRLPRSHLCEFWNNNDGRNLINTNPYHDTQMDQQIIYGMLAGESDDIKVHENIVVGTNGTRVFQDHGPTKAIANATLRRHLNAREKIVEIAQIQHFNYGGNAPNANLWTTSMDTIGPAAPAVLDAVNSGTYVTGCHNAIWLVMLAGVLEANPGNKFANWFNLTVGNNPIGKANWNVLGVQTGVPKMNWIPGDQGHITNPNPVTRHTDGWQGHNMIYVGDKMFADMVGGTDSLQAAIDEVQVWAGAGYSAKVDSVRRFPRLAGP